MRISPFAFSINAILNLSNVFQSFLSTLYFTTNVVFFNSFFSPNSSQKFGEIPLYKKKKKEKRKAQILR